MSGFTWQLRKDAQILMGAVNRQIYFFTHHF